MEQSGAFYHFRTLEVEKKQAKRKKRTSGRKRSEKQEIQTSPQTSRADWKFVPGQVASQGFYNNSSITNPSLCGVESSTGKETSAQVFTPSQRHHPMGCPSCYYLSNSLQTKADISQSENNDHQLNCDSTQNRTFPHSNSDDTRFRQSSFPFPVNSNVLQIWRHRTINSSARKKSSRRSNRRHKFALLFEMLAAQQESQTTAPPEQLRNSRDESYENTGFSLTSKDAPQRTLDSRKGDICNIPENSETPFGQNDDQSQKKYASESFAHSNFPEHEHEGWSGVFTNGNPFHMNHSSKPSFDKTRVLSKMSISALLN